MDVNIELPGNAVEQKKESNSKRHVTVGESDIRAHPDARLSFGALPITGSQYQIPDQSQLSAPPNHAVPQSGSISSSGFLTTTVTATTTTSPSLQAGVGGLDNVTTHQIETSFWDPDVIDDLLLSSTATGLASNSTPPSPSQLLRELDTTSQGIVGTDILINNTGTGVSHPHHNDDTNEPQETHPSGNIRRPLRYRRSARLKESLESVRGDDDDDDEGWLGALHIAAQSGQARMVDILIEQGEDPNEQDSDGRTPLMHAVINGHEAVAQLLIARGACVGAVDRDARSVLHWAALYRREGMLRMFLARRDDGVVQDRADVDAYDDAGWTPLHMAVYRGFEVGVRMLLQAGARLDSKAQKCPFARKLDALGLS
ncbi:ankyrin repeat-containing domain protein [Daldinia bambusicola]|nr:ankyrin repeat-containing domain protein [Daldinia bambusicola]